MKTRAPIGNDRVPHMIWAWSLPIWGLIAILICGNGWQPWQRLLAGAVGILLLLKGTVLLRHSFRELAGFSKLGLALYMTVWPGMDPGPFRENRGKGALISPLLKNGLVWMATGLLLACGIVWKVRSLGDEWIGWMGMAALLMLIHLGYSDVLTAFMRRGGWKVRRLFDEPFKSRSLADFWSRRWNIAFIEMDRIFFLKPLLRLCGRSGAILGIFLISGLLHEIAISNPAQAGWGLPLLYFSIQGGLVLLESRPIPIAKWPIWLAKIWTWFWIMGSLPLLFHGPFRTTLIIPLFRNLHRILFL